MCQNNTTSLLYKLEGWIDEEILSLPIAMEVLIPIVLLLSREQVKTFRTFPCYIVILLLLLRQESPASSPSSFIPAPSSRPSLLLQPGKKEPVTEEANLAFIL